MAEKEDDKPSSTRGRRRVSWRPLSLPAPPPLSSIPLRPSLFPTAFVRRGASGRGGGHRRGPGQAKGAARVRRVFVPASLSSFTNCYWPSLEQVEGSTIKTFSRAVELSLPFWQKLSAEDEKGWEERAEAEGRRPLFVYIKEKPTTQAAGGNGVEAGLGLQGNRKATSPLRPKSPRLASDSPSSTTADSPNSDDGEYDDVSDTDELPSRPLRKLNIVGEDLALVDEFKSILKQPTEVRQEKQPGEPVSPPAQRKMVSFAVEEEAELDGEQAKYAGGQGGGLISTRKECRAALYGGSLWDSRPARGLFPSIPFGFMDYGAQSLLSPRPPSLVDRTPLWWRSTRHSSPPALPTPLLPLSDF